MRVIGALAAIATLVGSAAAAQEDTPSIQEACTGLGEVAEYIMIKRQDGVPMNTLMGAVSGDLTKGFVIKAYKTPLFTSEEVRGRSIAEFRNSAELYCFEALRTSD